MANPLTFKSYKGFRYRYVSKNNKWCIEFPGGFKAYPPALERKTEAAVVQFIDDLVEQFNAPS